MRSITWTDVLRVGAIVVACVATYRQVSALVDAWAEPPRSSLTAHTPPVQPGDVDADVDEIRVRCGLAPAGSGFRERLRGESAFTGTEHHALEACLGRGGLAELRSIATERDDALAHEALRAFAERKWHVGDGRAERVARTLVPDATDLSLTVIEELLAHR